MVKPIRAGLVGLLVGAGGMGALFVVAAVREARMPLVDLSLSIRPEAQSDVPVARPGIPGRQAAGPGSDRLRFAVASMVSVEATFSTYRHLVELICRRVDRAPAFVLRPSYAEVRQALEEGQVDVAFVCTGTYVHGLAGGRVLAHGIPGGTALRTAAAREAAAPAPVCEPLPGVLAHGIPGGTALRTAAAREAAAPAPLREPLRGVRLLVRPKFAQGRSYRSVFIVPVDSPAQRLEDLRGGVMAFTDPESNTGRMVPCVALADLGLRTGTFFRQTVYTGSHDRSIKAVRLRMVDAAAVDSLVWESAKETAPALAQEVRVIWSSEAFGEPPVVVSAGLDEGLVAALRAAFLGLHAHPEGRAILSAIGIERFVVAEEADYRSAAEVYARFRSLENP